MVLQSPALLLRPDPLLSRADFGEPGPASGSPSSRSHLSRNRGAERKARGSWKGKTIEAVQTFPQSVKLGGRLGVRVRVAVAGGGGDPRGGAALGRVGLHGSQAQEAEERPWSLTPAPSPRKLPCQLTSLWDHSPPSPTPISAPVYFLRGRVHLPSILPTTPFAASHPHPLTLAALRGA